MSYCQRPAPRRIEIGSEFVTIPPEKYGTTQTARILRRVDDDANEPVHLVLDRLVSDHNTVFDCHGVMWRATGCIATELRRDDAVTAEDAP